jgi:Uma2 family endonuclease
MGMLAYPPEEELDRRYVRHSREYLASQRWTADRVRAELVDEEHPSPRYEFIDGVLIVTASPAYRHQAVVSELLVRLHAYLGAHEIGRVAASPSDVEVAPNTTAQPDVFVVPLDEHARLRADRTAMPVRRLLLAVEVVSPSSRRTDRFRKRRFYARAGVPDYWVVDMDDRAFEASHAGSEDVRMVQDVLNWQPAGAVDPFVLDVRAFFEVVLGPDPMPPDGPDAGAPG